MAPANFTEFHRSITDELHSVKNRIRDLLTHWPTDGEMKEVALRSVLRRHLPPTAVIGRGFVISKQGHSTQIDILILDSRKPTLFHEGDLFVVTPDAVLAAIEVKTSQDSTPEVVDTLRKLAEIERSCYDVTRKKGRVWTGLFVYDAQMSGAEKHLLSALGKVYRETDGVINCISYGQNVFTRFWSSDITVGGNTRRAMWRSYKLPSVAPSYFIGNLVDSISRIDVADADFAWFPLLGGKEQYKRYYLLLNSETPKECF
jgi:hypothetical protein